MNSTMLERIGQGMMVVALALGAACAETTPLGPNDGSAMAPIEVVPGPEAEVRAPELGTCDELQPPAGSRLTLRAYAKGDQIYRWNGTSWTFVAPSALLYATPKFRGVIGDHYAGPTWRGNGGSLVVGTVLDRCDSPDNAIPWLLLGAASNSEYGIFKKTTHIQRVNTVGGTAPVTAGSVIGQEVRVPYTAVYYFYRAK